MALISFTFHTGLVWPVSAQSWDGWMAPCWEKWGGTQGGLDSSLSWHICLRDAWVVGRWATTRVTTWDSPICTCYSPHSLTVPPGHSSNHTCLGAKCCGHPGIPSVQEEQLTRGPPARRICSVKVMQSVFVKGLPRSWQVADSWYTTVIFIQAV